MGYAAAFAAGCSSKTTSSGGTSGDSCANTANNCIVPPAAPTGATTVTASHNYAVHTLYLGDTNRQGVSSTTAWEAFGYNLDDKVTTETSTDVCTLAAGAAKSTQVDGNGGIDNSFGSQIMPIVITAAGSNASSEINTAIQEGHFTIMTYVTGFDDTSGSTASGTGLSGLLLAGGDYSTYFDGGAPAWNTTTNWPIVPTLMTGCSATSGCPGCTYGDTSCGTNPLTAAQITFPQAYQANGTFVNGSPATLSLNLSIGGQSLAINVHSATITFQPGTTAGTVTNGTIAGALITSELVSSLQGVAGHISTSLCQGSAFEAIEQEIEQASDIIVDPNSGAVTNTSGTACNAISIGLGFDAEEIAAPTAADIEAPAAAVANPCDAGTD